MRYLSLHIPPVYSQKSDDQGHQIGSVQLLKHQAATWEAYNDPDVDIIFNVAMTGDGKSLAAYLPAFREHKHVIAMYPTNELIQDQHKSLSNYQQRLDIRLPSNAPMYSEEISRLMLKHDTSIRMEEVRKLLKRNDILLTNPDLVHLIMSLQYGWAHQRKELPFELGANFNYFLFDEFHVFGVPQVISVMNMIGYLATLYRDKPTADRKKFIFLSATPNKLLNKLLERGGLRYRRIEGSYSSSAQEGYHRILQPCELELHEISQEAPTEAWIEGHLEKMLHFLKLHQGSKAAILVYSVATARRLYARLKDYFEPHSISVGENTGLTYRDDRRASYEKDILVGTSTVDIGVDFHINYLIFEAFNSGSFLQRFGRLGRHDEFDTYRAYGLIPRFVLERITQKLGTETEVERIRFNEVIREAFPTEEEFEQYTKRWGVIQAAHVLMELQRQGKTDENSAFTEALTECYDQLYGTPEEPAMRKAKQRYWSLREKKPQILEELLSFRGQSPLSCGVWDTDNHLKTYNLFFLLTNTDFEVMEKADFLQEVKRRGLEERDFKDQLLYLKIREYIPERQYLMLQLPYDLAESPNALHHAQVLNRFLVRNPRPVWLDKVNQSLKTQKLVCVLSDMVRTELKQRLHLGAMFEVLRLEDSTGNEYSVAFGQEALLLDSLLFFRKTKGDKAIMA